MSEHEESSDGAVTQPASIEERLRRYPHLHKTLGPHWIKEEDETHPAKSKNALARWLRIDGFEPRLELLDRLLGQFEHRGGMKERRKRLKGDPPALSATMVELNFAGWLADNGYQFEITKEGPDFLIQTTEGETLEFEATTPRRDVWFKELFDRIMYIKRTTGLALRFGFYREDLPNYGEGINRPDAALTETLVMDIVEEALSKASAVEGPSGPDAPAFTQERTAIGFRATWWNDNSQYMSGNPGVFTPSGGEVWGRIRAAALEKTEDQLPTDRACGLLVGANEMNDGDLRMWGDWVEREPDEWVWIRWEQIPPQVKYICLYKASWGKPEPACAVLMINRDSPFEDPPGFEEFRQRMFPIRYRTVPSKLEVWASSDRCFDPRWF